MVIPPEPLPPKQRIFDLIDSIRTKISSQEYVDLMNTAKELVEQINDEEQEEISGISDSSSIDSDRIYYERNNILSDNREESNSESESEIEETSNDTPCDCLSRFAYPEDFPISGNHQTYSQMFCHGMRIFECENFRRLCEEYPILNNLIEHQNTPFADRETYAIYDSPKVKRFFSILLSLNDILDYRRHKIIISLILFDFAMKNIQFIADSRNSFGKIAYDKFISFIYEDDFPEIAEEFNINLNNWRLAFEIAIQPPAIN